MPHINKQELEKMLQDQSEEWRKGFFAAVNLNSATKAAFLRCMVGEEVGVRWDFQSASDVIIWES